MKKVASILEKAKDFICERCFEAMKEIVEPAEKFRFHDQVEQVKGFYDLENRLNASDEREAAVTARTRIKWIEFREYGVLLEESFREKGKEQTYWSFIRSVMLCNRET